MEKLLLFFLLLPALNGKAQTAMLSETAPNAVSPKGWLLEFLQRQRTGLTGHPEVMSYPYNTVLWAGDIQRDDEQHGANWWRYEQTAYYSDGLLRLGYLLKDSAMIGKALQGVQYTLDHVQSNGRLGPSSFTSQWPIAVYFRVLLAAYLSTGDQTIVDALHRHYLSYEPDELGNFKRNIVNIEGALWTYGKTGDARLLTLSEKAWHLGGFELNATRINANEKDSIHGVTYMEMAKLPAILYMYTGKKEYLHAAIRAMQKLDRDHMLPDGVPSSNEFLAGKDPLQSHETCDITDYTWTLGYLIQATGNAQWADKIERAIFNAGPGAVSKDFKNLQYFSSVNQVIATGKSNHNKFAHGSTWMAYWPCHETECCAGNVHRFMPNYAARMWMKDRDGFPVAVLYGPSVYRHNDNCIITASTAYPFDEEIVFEFSMKKKAFMHFSFRIPQWCEQATVSVNNKNFSGLQKNGFITIKRAFGNGDKIRLLLPMKAKLVPWLNNGVFVERGPLLYAYAVPETVRIDTARYANLGNKRSSDPAFPALDIQPAGPWNFGLNVAEKNIRVIKQAAKGYPFDLKSMPVKILVPVHKIADWELAEGRYTPRLPLHAVSIGDTVITLVPYGATRLRVTVFPAIAGSAKSSMLNRAKRKQFATTSGARSSMLDHTDHKQTATTGNERSSLLNRTDQIPAATTNDTWKFENFGEQVNGSMQDDKDHIKITTKNSRHAFFESDAYSFAWKDQAFPYDDCSQLTVTTRIDSVSGGAAGIMMRSGTALGAANVHLETSATGDVYLFYRKANNGSTAYTHLVTLSFPIELKLLRQGNNFTGYYKNKEGAWTKGGSVMSQLDSFCLTGFYACSGNVNDQYTHASFSNWNFNYKENFIPAEKQYKDTMAVKDGTLLRDNFNDGSLSNKPETITNPVWKGIVYGQLPYAASNKGRYWQKTGDGLFYLGNKKWTDYELGIDLAFDNTAGEVEIRLRNQEIPIYNNAKHYALLFRNDAVFFEKRVGGQPVFSKRIQAPDIFNGNVHHLKIKLVDNAYAIYIDDKPVCSGIDSLDPVTYGDISFKFSNAAVRLDNLEVIKIKDEMNGDADNFLQDYFNTPLPAWLKKYGWE